LSLTDFQNFPGPVALFQDFPVLENATVFQDFPGFPGPIRTLVAELMGHVPNSSSVIFIQEIQCRERWVPRKGAQGEMGRSAPAPPPHVLPCAI